MKPEIERLLHLDIIITNIWQNIVYKIKFFDITLFTPSNVEVFVLRYNIFYGYASVISFDYSVNLKSMCSWVYIIFTKPTKLGFSDIFLCILIYITQKDDLNL